MNYLDKTVIQDIVKDIKAVQIRKYELEQREKELFEELGEFLNNLPVTSEEEEFLNDSNFN